MERTEVRAVDLDSRKQQQAPAVADVMAISAANGTGYVAPSTRLRNVEPEGGKVKEKCVSGRMFRSVRGEGPGTQKVCMNRYVVTMMDNTSSSLASR
jgi:hypothetical protein